MAKENVVHVYSEILTIKKNKIGPFVEMWMDLESVIQNEVSQREKNTVYKYIHVGSREMV